MDYVANKGVLSGFGNDTPSKYASLVNNLKNRTGENIPFFLLPLRLETRFMYGIEKNLLEEALSQPLQEVLESSNSLYTLMNKFANQNKIASSAVLIALKQIEGKILILAEKTGELTSINFLEKQIALKSFAPINTELNNAVNQLKSFCTDTDFLHEIENSIFPELEQSLIQIIGNINELRISTQWKDRLAGAILTFGQNIQSNYNPSSLFNGGAPNEDNLRLYVTNLGILLNNLTSLQLGIWQEKLFAYEKIQELNDQCEFVLSRIDNSNSANRTIRLEVFIAFNKINDLWKTKLNPNAQRKSYLQYVKNYDQLSEEEETEVIAYNSNLVTQLRGLISTHITIGNELKNQNWEHELSPQTYVSNLDSISDIISQLRLNENDIQQKFFNKELKLVDNLLVEVQEAYNKYSSTSANKTALLNSGYNFSLSWLDALSYDVWDNSVFTTTYTVDELWIRAYPDDIHINHHEKDLTTSEHNAGIAYWDEWWDAAGDPALQLEAWQKLVALYGEQRAAWIAKSLTPVNLANAVISPVYAATQQVATLNTLTTQLTSLSTAELSAMPIDSYIQTYTLHAESLVSKANEMREVLSSAAEVLNNQFSNFQANFEQLSTNFIEANESCVDALNSIQGSFQNFADQLQNINLIDSWAELYAQDPEYPDVDIKPENWTEASFTNVLPDRLLFAAISINEDSITNPDQNVFQHIKIGNWIPETLFTSIKPDANGIGVERNAVTNDLDFDNSIKWMFDYQQAVQDGMACSLVLNPQEAQFGFRKVLVFGVKLFENDSTIPTTNTAAEQEVKNRCRNLLEDLLDNHHYANDGMSLIRIGTPTNNTDEETSGFNKPDPLNQSSFQVEVQNPLFNVSGNKMNRKDGQWISDALGISPGIFYHIKGSGNTQITNAIAMNRALWNGTIGNYMTEMLNKLVTNDSVNRTKSYFSDYVIARGMIPSIRIGNQPYGILATTSFTRWYRKNGFSPNTNQINLLETFCGGQNEISIQQFLAANSSSFTTTEWSNYLDDRYHTRLFKLFEVLNLKWLETANSQVSTVHKKNVPTSEKQRLFMNVLGADATVMEVYNRFLVNNAAYKSDPSVNFNSFSSIANELPDSFFTEIGSSLRSDAKDEFNGILNALTNLSSIHGGLIFDNQLISEHGYNGNKLERLIRAFMLNPMMDEYLLRGPSIEENFLSEFAEITPVAGSNYIQWLLNNTLSDVFHGNDFQNMQSRALLFLLLRQSLLLTYRNVSWDTLVKAGIFSNEGRSIVGTTDGMIYHLDGVDPGDGKMLTKWDAMFNSLATLRNGPSYKSIFKFSDFNNSGSSTKIVSPTSTLPTWGSKVLANYLLNPSPVDSNLDGILTANKSWDQINQVRGAFDSLKNLSTAELDRLMNEHIALCSYRLDSWNYGMVHKKLWKTLRNVDGTNANATKGSYLGSYGWLFDVKPSNSLIKIDAQSPAIPADLQQPSGNIFFDTGNLGFIHTPSVAHALTASILRSGYVSETGLSENRFSVNLTSERVLLANNIIHGIRNGQTLPELLGYEFEKRLRDNYTSIGANNLNSIIYALRKKFPLVAIPNIDLSQDNVPTKADNIRETNVLDGLSLLQSFRNDTNLKPKLDQHPKESIYEIFQKFLPPGSTTLNPSFSIYTTWLENIVTPTSSENAIAVLMEIDRIANSTDAVADICLTEGIFQLASGNPTKSAAVMESLTEGKNIPEIEVTNSPRTGIHVSYRMMGLIDTYPTLSATTIIGKLDPYVNNWVHNIIDSHIPNYAANIKCEASYKDLSNTLISVTVTLSDLTIDPITLVKMSSTEGYSEEFYERIKFYVRFNNSLSGSTEINVNLSLSTIQPERNFSSVLTLLAALNECLNNSSVLTPNDFLASPNSLGNQNLDFNELALRVTYLVNTEIAQLRVAINSLPSSITNQTELNLYNLVLAKAKELGFNSLPKYYAEDFSAPEFVKIETECKQQISFIKRTISDRILELCSGSNIVLDTNVQIYPYTSPNLLPFLPLPSTSMSSAQKVDNLKHIVNTLFGKEVQVITLFDLTNNSTLETSISNQMLTSNDILTGLLRNHTQGSSTSQEIDMVMENWMYSLSRVDSKIETLESIKMFCDATELKNIRPSQMPESSTATADYWLGLPYDIPAVSGYAPEGDKLSVVMYNQGLFNSGMPYAGLLFHSWTEIIPNKEEVTGLAFHYDQPNAKPPQNALLMVHPGDAVDTYWRVEDILFGLLDTIEMAKIRMVEPDHFVGTEFGKLYKWALPAIIGEVTPHSIDPKPYNNINQAPTSNDYQEMNNSIEQVSFEYNPNNEPMPTPATLASSINSVNPNKILNIAELDSDTILFNNSSVAVSAFVNSQASLNAINSTLQQLQNLI